MDSGVGTLVVGSWRLPLPFEWLHDFPACMLCGGPHMSSMRWTAGLTRL